MSNSFAFQQNVITNIQNTSTTNNNQNINLIVNTSNVNIQKQENYNINNNILVINKFGDSNNGLKNPVETHPNFGNRNSGHMMTENENLFFSNKSNQNRNDTRGIPITKGSKKHKVTFIDKVPSRKNLLTVIDVESFKLHNMLNTYPDQGYKKNASLACCDIL